MLNGESGKIVGVVLTQELEVLAILKGAMKSFHPLKRGCERFAKF